MQEHGKRRDAEKERCWRGALDPAIPRTRIARIWTYVAHKDRPYTVNGYTPNSTMARD
jgi:hypothetical protein